MNISSLSKSYKVKVLDENDVEEIYGLCLGNPLYYQYCPPPVSRESVLDDLKVLPVGKSLADKHFVGFYHHDKLLAVMDLIDDYPQSKQSFIGFFMMNKNYQGKGMGSKIMAEVLSCLKKEGVKSVRLGYIAGNKQAESFWKKNGFAYLEEKRGQNVPFHIVVLEKRLTGPSL